MTQHNLTQILKVIRDLVMRNRPCYRDYLGSETVTNTVQIGSSVFIDDKGIVVTEFLVTDSAFAGFVLGETYTVTIDGVTADYVARNLSPLSNEIGPIIGTATTFDMENHTFDGWICVAIRSPDGKVACNAQTFDMSFVGKTISISQTKTETVKRYKTKLLPEYLLPDFLRKNVVASKTEVQSAAAKATAAKDAASNAQTIANDAQTEASSALFKANNAQTTANNAQTTANTAKSTADEAKTKATNAYTKASIAETTAQDAVSFTTTQSRTDTEKKKARDNIGAGTSSFSGDFTDLNNQVVGMKSKLETAHISTYTIPASNEQLNGVYISHCQETAHFYASIVEFGGVFYGTRLADISTNPATPQRYYVGNLSLLKKAFPDYKCWGFASGPTTYTYEHACVLDTQETFLIITSPDSTTDLIMLSTEAIKETTLNTYSPGYFDFFNLPISLLTKGVQRVGDPIYLLSSTSNSDKQFRITVDDTGSLTTESNGVKKTTGTYSKPSGGIPKTDLSDAVQASLGKADIIGTTGSGHNSIYRGKYLGTSVTEAQWQEIANGTFDDMYIGDYWTIGGITYRIAAFDYYLRTGDFDMTTHHATLVPDEFMYEQVMNDSNTTTGGYVGSKMYTTGLDDAKATINNAFGSAHILTHRQYLCNAVSDGKPSGSSWYDSTVELMTEQNVYGGRVFGAISDGSTTLKSFTVDKSQYPLFVFRPDLISDRHGFWLRDVVSNSHFAHVHNVGFAAFSGALDSKGVRPAFSIKS